MKLKNITMFATLLILMTSIFSITIYAHSAEKNVFHSSLNGGWLETRNGVRIIHLNGSYYDMGYQLATLLKEDYLASRRAWLEYLPYSYDELLDLWNGLKHNIPKNYIDEIQGRADALNMSFNDIAIMEVLGLGIFKDKKCCQFAAWGPATIDEKLYHFRSCDGPLAVRDPVTEKYASNDQLLIVRNPNYGYSSVIIGLSVEVGAEGGFNEHGIGIGFSSVYTSDINTDGIPSGIRKRMLLEVASSLNRAVEIYSKNATCGWNVIISDGKISEAVAIEQSGNYTQVCNWNDSQEDVYPSWGIDHVIRRGNFFLDPISAGLDKDIYKKSNIFRYFLSLFGFKTDYTFYGPILHYKVMSKAIDEELGNLDLNTSMNMMRDVYQGKTSLYYKFFKIFLPVYTQTWHQWTVCPETGDMAVSFANNTITAYKTPVHYFNIYDIMNEQI